MIEKIYRFKCADCPTSKEYATKDEGRAFGWAIANGGKECYCPACAFRHRSPGRLGVKKTPQEANSLKPNWAYEDD